jgi:hypothetical protein
MDVFIADSVNQALTMNTCPHAESVYCCNIPIHSIYELQTELLTEIRKIITWQLAKDRLKCPTNVCEVG